MKFLLEVELDKLVMTDGVASIGKQVASVLRFATLGKLEENTGSVLDWDGEIAGKWLIQPTRDAATIEGLQQTCDRLTKQLNECVKSRQKTRQERDGYKQASITNAETIVLLQDRLSLSKSVTKGQRKIT